MRALYLPVLATALIVATPIAAHHSASIYDTSTLLSIEGTVTQYDFKNPHTYIQIETTDAAGTRLTNIEAGSISWLGPLGLARDSFDVGDRVTVHVYPPARASSKIVLGREIITQDGDLIPLNSMSPYANNSASTGHSTDISGTWVMQNGANTRMHELQDSWKLTEAGIAVLAGHDGISTPQSECIPMSVPHLLLYPVVNLIEIGAEAVSMRIDWMDSERTIYTDGRAHPPADQRFLHGHSVGRWEDDEHTVLAVETTNFADHAAGTGYGIPSGANKRVIERFELSDDGSQLIYAGTLESPEYLAEPATWRFVLNNRPELQHSERGCDPASARRFEIE